MAKDPVGDGTPVKAHPTASLAWAVVVAAPLAGAAAALLKLLLDVAYPFPLDYGEGIALDRCIALANGEPLYTALGEAPFVTWNFPPLYAWACAALASVTGSSFAAGRAISLTAAVAAAALVGVSARRAGVSSRWAVAAACLFLGSGTVSIWGGLMRVDALGVAFGLAGLASVAAGVSPLLAGALFALAFLCKQSLFAALAGSLLFLAWSGRWRRAGLVVLAYATVVGAVVLGQKAAAGPVLWKHLFTANMNAWSAAQLARELGRFGEQHFVLAALALVGWLIGPRGRRPGLPTCYLAAAAVAALLAGKAGAGINYFLDLTAALAIVGAGGAERLVSALARRLGASAAQGIVAALVAAHVLLAAPFRQAGAHPRTAYLRAAVPVLAAAPGPLVSDDPGLVVAVGKRLWFQPFEFTQMAVSGAWDQEPMLRALRAGEVGMVAIHFDPWDDAARDAAGTWESGAFTAEMVDSIRARYQPAYRSGPLWILRPKPTTRGGR